MRNLAMFAALAGAILTTACNIPLSVNRLYTDKDLASDVQLEGTWTDEKAEEIWAVERNGDAYTAAELGAPESEAISIHVVSLGPNRFLDITPRKTPDLAIEGHFFLKLRIEGDELALQGFDWQWLKPKAEQAGLGLVETAGKQLILTAPTPELRKFIAQYANEPKALDSDVSRMHRVR